MGKLRKSWKFYAILFCAIVGLAFVGIRIATESGGPEQTAQGEWQAPPGTKEEPNTPEVPPTQTPKGEEQTQVPEATKSVEQEPTETGLPQNPTRPNQQSETAGNASKPGTTSSTGNTAVAEGTKPQENGNVPKDEENPPHQHTWTEWTYQNDDEEVRTCSSCESKETRPHSFGKVETIFLDNEDGTHKVTEKYACTTCQTAEYTNTVTKPHQYDDGEKTIEANKNGTHTITTEWKCIDCENVRTNPVTEKCKFGNWVFDKKSKDVRCCEVCGYEETRPHQTVQQPEDNHERPVRPGGGGSSGGTTHQHMWTEWTYQNDDEEVRTCSSCGSKETRPHSFARAEKTAVDIQNGNHEVTEKYICTTCQTAEYTSTFTEPHQYGNSSQTATANQDGTHTLENTYTCTACNSVYTDTVQEDCQYGNWQFGENNEDVRGCTKCTNTETRPHEHSQAPEGLTYIYQASNDDGTHRLEATYTCAICQQEAIAARNESCDYGEVTYERTGVNDIHLLVSVCKICQYRNEEEGTCEPTGELKLIKVYAQIYEYYDCAQCGDWCQRRYHTVHQFEPWKYRDEDTHIRYCICVEEREIGEHSYAYDGTTTMTCNECGSTKTVPIHNHGYGVQDNMGLMEILGTDAYKYELPNKSQVANPNPTPDSYCSRYEFVCRTCGVKYYIHYDHKFVNGVCTRTGYCGGIAQSQAEEPDMEETVLEELDAMLPTEETSKQEESSEEAGDGVEPEREESE